MRVFMQSVDHAAGPLVDITESEDGQKALEYVEAARALGLSDAEIEEDLGGWESKGRAHHGLIAWACEAELVCGTLILGAVDLATVP